MSEHVPEKGLLSFIKMKLQSSVSPEDIKKMLLRAGFPESHIDGAFDHVRKIHADTHQDLAASHDFLPKLNKEGREGRIYHIYPEASMRASRAEGIDHADVRHHAGRANVDGASHAEHAGQADQPEHKGLFAGRLRRKDFVLGFLFFFGIGYTTLAFSAVAVSAISPHLWNTILMLLESDDNNLLLTLVPVILAPVTIMMMSLIVRRLHNLGIPGGLSLIFLVWFLPSFSDAFQYGLAALEAALSILFVVLVTVKGDPAPNRYGALPGSRGSFFRRIFNI